MGAGREGRTAEKEGAISVRAQACAYVMGKNMAETAAAQAEWKGQYEALMQQLGMGIESDEKARKSPRFTFLPPDRILLVHIGSLVGFIRDISAGGLSFHMDMSLTVGRQIDVSIDQKFRGLVNVVNNILDESRDSDTYGMYRISTKFLNENDGYRCMVRTLKLSSQAPRF